MRSGCGQGEAAAAAAVDTVVSFTLFVCFLFGIFIVSLS